MKKHFVFTLAIVALALVTVAVPDSALAADGGGFAPKSILTALAKAMSLRTGSLGWMVLSLAFFRAIYDYFFDGRKLEGLIKFGFGAMSWPILVALVEHLASKIK